MDGDRTPLGSCVRYFAKRVERDITSGRLRQVSVRVLERVWPSELKASALEAVHLLNHLNVDVDDMVEKDRWIWLLVHVIRFPAGLESLSPYDWRLLDSLASTATLDKTFASLGLEIMGLRDYTEVTR